MTHIRNRIAAGCCVLTVSALIGQKGSAQEPAGATIKTETRLVLVDAVVTDKKGDYVRGLAQKDFKVYEDNHEQTITSFSFEADPAAPTNSQPRYLVLFFDNSTMDMAHQRYSRDAAAKFVQANAGPKRMMAIVEYGASLHIAQNFTDDADRLKQVVSGVKLAPRMTDSNGLAVDGLNRAAAAYGTRNSILALKSLVKNLASVPGRKSLVLFSGGFRLNMELTTELNELVDACNKANVAVYPIDARGLVAVNAAPDAGQLLAYGGFRIPGMSFLLQTKPPAGGGGGTTRPPTGGGGGTTKPPSTGGGTTAPRANTPITTQPQRAVILPTNPFPPSATDNQMPLYTLANGTGGFIIVNTNDLLGGLEKIGKEQNEHYMIGYSPERFEEGKCHALKVKITQSGMTVRARTGYCDVKPPDLLSGNPIEKDLEKLILTSNPGTVEAAMQAPYFYTSPNSARMNVALEVPSSVVKFEKHKGKFHGQVNILGIVYRPDNGVAARFSDTLKFDFEDKKSMEAWQENPLIRYEKDVDGVPGTYTLKLVVSSGANSFAKLELPISIDSYDGKKFSLSGLAFSTKMRKVSQTDTGLDTVMEEDRTPLIVNGLQIFPSARSSFKKTETVALYAEMYEPVLNSAEPPKEMIGTVRMRLLDAKTGVVKVDSGPMRTCSSPTDCEGKTHQGNPVVPVALKVPVDKLEAGNYVCELSAGSTSGSGETRRVANFTVQ
jgi:VWFA-related protein